MVNRIGRADRELYQCEECGFYYAEREWAEKCEAWCREHQSCNLKITAHAARVVLFACAENKKRSQMAEAIFNHFATKAYAISAGTMPADKVDPRIGEVLQEIGIPVRGVMLPKKVTDKMLQGAERIVSFGCLVPSQFPSEKFEEWQIPDPQTDEELRSVRDALVEKIKGLIRAHDF
jgi:protein-tyrosine-phosphatase